MELERKSIDEMTKAELKRELDGLRCEYDTLKVKDDIIKILDRMPTSIELEEIRKYAEKVYQKSIDKHWYFLNGVHDNICNMVDNLLETGDYSTLNYLNCSVYGKLLDENPTATEGVKTMTGDMEKLLLKHLMAERGGVA